MRRALHGLLLCALWSVPAVAGTFKLKDGTRFEAKVRSYDPATQTLYLTTADGKQASYTMAQLDGRSVYQVNASLIPSDDPKAQLLAANFARDAGLYAHAARRYAKAVQLDPSMRAAVEPEVTKLKRVAAEGCMANARAAIAKGDTSEAEKWLKALIEKLPGEPEAAQASSMLDQYYAQTRAVEVARVEQKSSEALKKDIAQGKRRYEEMVDKTKKALQARGSGQAENLFRNALSDGQAVLKELDGIQDKYDEPEVQERVVEYRQIVTDQMVEVHLHIASQLATQSDYKGAQREVNQALALDSKNERALSMRARIEEYSSQGIGWRGWL